jgi:hypothetical protein
MLYDGLNTVLSPLKKKSFLHFLETKSTFSLKQNYHSRSVFERGAVEIFCVETVGSRFLTETCTTEPSQKSGFWQHASFFGSSTTTVFTALKEDCQEKDKAKKRPAGAAIIILKKTLE